MPRAYSASAFLGLNWENDAKIRQRFIVFAFVTVGQCTIIICGDIVSFQPNGLIILRDSAIVVVLVPINYSTIIVVGCRIVVEPNCLIIVIESQVILSF